MEFKASFLFSILYLLFTHSRLAPFSSVVCFKPHLSCSLCMSITDIFVFTKIALLRKINENFMVLIFIHRWFVFLNTMFTFFTKKATFEIQFWIFHGISNGSIRYVYHTELGLDNNNIAFVTRDTGDENVLEIICK